MTHALVISDLHLSNERPAIKRAFFDLLAGPARVAHALYILGDLFEAWVGDDALEASPADENADAVAAIAALSRSGVRVFFIAGNRDFLVGNTLAARAGWTQLADPTLIDLFGTRTLLAHGDALCTDDVDYQRFRAMVREPRWQSEFLAKPLGERRAIAARLRAQSEHVKAGKAPDIMDVNANTVAALLREHGYPRLIHGHTHRPARHVHHIDGHACERYVLADWYARASALRVDAGGVAAIEY